MSGRKWSADWTPNDFFCISRRNIRRHSYIIDDSIETTSVVDLSRVKLTGLSGHIEQIGLATPLTSFGCKVEVERQTTT